MRELGRTGMKRHWVEFAEHSTAGPITYWVHVPFRDDPNRLIPPRPALVPDKRSPVYYAEVDGFTFQFALLGELRVCIGVLGKKLLPTRYGWPRNGTAKIACFARSLNPLDLAYLDVSHDRGCPKSARGKELSSCETKLHQREIGVSLVCR
jgi:hypothetical protein